MRSVLTIAETFDHLLVLFHLSLHVHDRLLLQLRVRLLLLVVECRFRLSLLLELLHHFLILPANLVRETTKRAVLSARFQADDAHRVRRHFSLLMIVRRWNALENLQIVQRARSTLTLVRNHASNGAPEDATRSAKVERSTRRIHVAAFAQKSQIFQLIAIETARDVDILATNHNNSLTLQDRLGNHRRKTAKQMTFRVDHNRFCAHRRHVGRLSMFPPIGTSLMIISQFE